MSNVEFLGAVDRAYTYIGFKLGKWDAEKKLLQQILKLKWRM